MGNLANRFKATETKPKRLPDKAPATAKPSQETGELAKRGPKPSKNAKKLITLRLSPAVIECYRAKGSGWQTMINDDLMRLNGIQ